jgi:hypothetical protein
LGGGSVIGAWLAHPVSTAQAKPDKTADAAGVRKNFSFKVRGIIGVP